MPTSSRLDEWSGAVVQWIYATRRMNLRNPVLSEIRLAQGRCCVSLWLLLHDNSRTE